MSFVPTAVIDAAAHVIESDLPWVLKYAGENCLLIGTDYGHGDPSSEVDATN